MDERLRCSPVSFGRTRLPRVESLTGLRWFAAFAVFAHHLNNFAPLPIIKDMAFGVTGVTFFFVLSGFVLTWSATANDTAGRFYWRRFARIWPLLAVSTLLAIPVFYGSSDSFQKPLDSTALIGIVLCLLLLQAWSDNPAIFFAGNPAAWSLSCEAFFYAIFPPTIRRAMPRGVPAMLMAAVGLVIVSWALLLWLRYAPPDPDSPLRIFFREPMYRVPEFLLGVVLGVAVRAGWRPRLSVPAAVGLVFLGIATLVLWRHSPGLTESFMKPTSAMNQLMAPLYGLLIVAVAVRDVRGGQSRLQTGWLVALGKWSYAFYLVHATVIYTFRLVLGVQPSSWSNVVWIGPMLLASIAVAAALYIWVEHPTERRLRAMLPPRPEEPPTADDPVPAATTTVAATRADPVDRDGGSAR